MRSMPFDAIRARAAGLSLSARLAVGLVLLLLLGGMVLASAAFVYGRTAAREAYDRLLVGAANDIALALAVEEGRLVLDLPVSAFQLLALARDDRIAYQVRGVDGAVLTGHADLPGSPAGDGFFNADFRGEEARFVRVSRRFAERNLSGRVEVVVGQTLRARLDLAYDITRKALYGLALGGVAIIVLALIVVRQALAPLDRIARHLSARDPQDLSPMAVQAPAEVQPLIGALNRFMGRLDRQLDIMRNLISDTAHQLRTPVAALRAQADLALGEADPQMRQRLVERIHGRSVGLGRLLDQMLSHALVVHRGGAAPREAVDLREIALDIVEGEDHPLMAAGAQVGLSIGAEPVIVRADAVSLREAARNLVSNALAHGVPPVSVGVEQRGATARLWVSDAGPGPSEAVVAELGARFLRDGGGGRAGGSGLGLSISKAVAEAFDGALLFERGDDGARAILSFPAEVQR